MKHLSCTKSLSVDDIHMLKIVGIFCNITIPGGREKSLPLFLMNDGIFKKYVIIIVTL